MYCAGEIEVAVCRVAGRTEGTFVIVIEGSIVAVTAEATVISVEAVLIFVEVEMANTDADVAVSTGIGIELVLFTVNSGAVGFVFATTGAELVVVRGVWGLAVLVLSVINLVELVLLNWKV